MLLVCFSGLGRAAAQEGEIPEIPARAVAFIPFHGDNRGAIAEFGRITIASLSGVSAGEYFAEPVNMNNLPPDVPPGGFPSYICPSPSLTRNAPYALTGDVYSDENDIQYLRLYLWEMASGRLLCSDVISANDAEECEIYLPSLLEWLFSWIMTETDPEVIFITEMVERPEVKDDEYWLYLALRAGSSFSTYARNPVDPFTDGRVSQFLNPGAAFQMAFHFTPLISLQGEAVFASDTAPFRRYMTEDVGVVLAAAPFTSYSLMFPLLLKLNLRFGPLYAAVFGGGYYALPLGQMENDRWGGDFDWSFTLPFGYTLGINLGMKLGKGVLFLDLRWAADLGEAVKASGEQIYRRSMFIVNVGYEIGLFKRKTGN